MRSNDIVYHYCSSDVFYSIINNKTIRFSDITKSNDSAEIGWITKYLDSVFTEELRCANNNLIFMKSYQPIDLHRCFLSFEDAYFIKALRDKDKFFWFYVSCFSMKGDILSQWRGYADDGKGFCIGFDRHEFEQYSTGGFKLLSLHSGEVNYLEEKQISDICGIIKELFDQLLKNAQSGKTSVQHVRIELNKCFQKLIELAVFIKNPFFKEEKEWRMCLWTYKEFSRDSKDIILVKNGQPEQYELGFKTRGNTLVSFFDMKFEPYVLKHIIVGPKNNTDLADLKMFLHSHNIDCRIEKSKGTYV